MDFLHLTTELLGKVDFERSKIIQPQKLVFVCGGAASRRPHAPASFRELLLNREGERHAPGYLAGSKVILAEDAVNALATSNFGNLLDLEEYIAAVVNSVLLIVESPGSICELGAFVKTYEICQKLVIVLHGSKRNVASFITKGAIAYLEKVGPGAEVLGFHRNTENNVVDAPEYVMENALIEISEAMKQVNKAHYSEKFDDSKLGHLIYLTLAFCHILRAAKISDIKNCYEAASIEISESEIKRCIDTLVICKLLKAVSRGKPTYYVGLIERIPLKLVIQEGCFRQSS